MDKKTIDKIQVKLENTNWITFKWKEGPTIEVNPYISLESKLILFTNYANIYFESNNFVDNYLNAKYALMLGVTDLCTNIDIKNLDIDGLVDSGLWEKIKGQIKNYNEIVSDLYNIVKLLSEQRIIDQSMGTVFDKLSIRIIDFIEGIDLSAEGIQKLMDALQKTSTDFDEKYKGSKKPVKQDNKEVEEPI